MQDPQTMIKKNENQATSHSRKGIVKEVIKYTTCLFLRFLAVYPSILIFSALVLWTGANSISENPISLEHLIVEMVSDIRSSTAEAQPGYIEVSVCATSEPATKSTDISSPLVCDRITNEIPVATWAAQVKSGLMRGYAALIFAAAVMAVALLGVRRAVGINEKA